MWTVEASSHFDDAMTVDYVRMGWGTYTSEHEWDRTTCGELGWV